MVHIFFETFSGLIRIKSGRLLKSVFFMKKGENT